MNYIAWTFSFVLKSSFFFFAEYISEKMRVQHRARSAETDTRRRRRCRTWFVCVCAFLQLSISAFCHPFTFQHIYVEWFLLGQMETHWLFQFLWSLVESTLIQYPLITVCSSTETEYCPRRRKKRVISGPNSSDEGRSDEDNVKLRTRAKSEISSYSRLRWFLYFLPAYIYWNSLCVWIPKNWAVDPSRKCESETRIRKTRGEKMEAHIQQLQVSKFDQTRPSVNNAKDWLNQHSSFLVLSCLEKSITQGCDHYGAVNNHFPVYLSVFGVAPGDNQMNNRTNNWVILVQACSWLVRRKSFAIGEHGKHVKMDNLEDMFFFVDDPTCCCRIWNPTLGLHWKAITSSPTLFD